jgi:predicted glycogen debranching enzyme
MKHLQHEYPTSTLPETLPPLEAEWLEADGLGGFASGTVSGIRTRCYHALLLTAAVPPGGRMVLVNGFDAVLETAHGILPLTAQCYAPGVIAPDHSATLVKFTSTPWPTWTFQAEGCYEVVQELLTPRDSSAVFLRWSVKHPDENGIRLLVRPFFSGRDFHSTHRENGSFCFDPVESDGIYRWTPYQRVPSTSVKSNGSYTHEPHWYRNFLCTEERSRGLNHLEDLAAPGVFAFDISSNSIAEMAFAASGHESILQNSFEEISQREGKRRAAFPSSLCQAADAYLVRRGKGSTIIAGYPWFGDWGRDTFIAMRGLCLATGRLDEARSILLEWANSVYAGLLPNRFADDGTSPEYNSVDAALWYIITAQEFLQSAKDVDEHDTQKLKSAIESILEGYSQGTSFRIKMDDDFLLACGVPGMQLTWMDARIDCDVVTPRIGKPVEVQALWLNALSVGATFNKHWAAYRDKGMVSFQAKFWNQDAAALFDVIDVDHQPGVNDGSIRPNQVFAIGGLPISLIEGARAKQVLETVERQLLTPAGLRTLAPGSQGYVGCYGGDAWHRDHAYHQGTVWPWLMGPYVQAWLRIHGNTDALRKEARTRFLDPLMKHYSSASLGHISEIADADEPHTPKGAPFQAWSMGELIRLEKLLTN